MGLRTFVGMGWGWGTKGSQCPPPPARWASVLLESQPQHPFSAAMGPLFRCRAAVRSAVLAGAVTLLEQELKPRAALLRPPNPHLRARQSLWGGTGRGVCLWSVEGSL